MLDSLIENLSKGSSWQRKALRLSDIIKSTAKKPPHEAIEYLYSTMYKGYLNSNGIEDSGKIELLKSLAALEPDIKSFLLRIERLSPSD